MGIVPRLCEFLKEPVTMERWVSYAAFVVIFTLSVVTLYLVEERNENRKNKNNN